MVPEAGLEPARLAAGDFESPASTNSTTRACTCCRKQLAAGSRQLYTSCGCANQESAKCAQPVFASSPLAPSVAPLAGLTTHIARGRIFAAGSPQPVCLLSGRMGVRLGYVLPRPPAAYLPRRNVLRRHRRHWVCRRKGASTGGVGQAAA